MKKLIFFFAAILTLQIVSAQNQTRKKPVYEAANWELKIIKNPADYQLPAPPDANQTKSELASMKKNSINDKKMKEIVYWDAGAPSYRWNQIGPSLVNPQKYEILMRTPVAWMNLAIYDATILAWKEKQKHKRKRPNEADHSVKALVATPITHSYPCEHTLTAAAAAYVMGYFYPDKADSILQLARNAGQSRIDAGVQYPSDVEAGWKLGEQVAKEVIEKAKMDGHTLAPDLPINKDPKKWTGNFALGLNLPKFSPIALRSGDQFRPGPPPDFEIEMKDLKNHKANFKANSLAYYWANNGGFDFWSEEASKKLFEYRMSDDAPVAARVYTVLHTAFHDAVIAIFDAKYAYWGIRPAQYDTSFKSLLMTPPFPGYPSGHAAGAATSCTVLEQFFPADAKYFQKLAQDCADSRFYAGIHFKSDNEVGLQLGKKIGMWVYNDFMNKDQTGASAIKK
jgi:membrane-associated phospholipid phosphatase